MLHDFIIENRTEIIRRCRMKLARRASPISSSSTAFRSFSISSSRSYEPAIAELLPGAWAASRQQD